MKSIVSIADNFGQGFIDHIESNSSLAIAGPLLAFLERSHSVEPLRSVVKLSRPALKADIAHFLNICFGRHPGIIDHAANKIVDQAAREWLLQAINGFAVERIFLNRLTIAAGPIHRQLGQERVTALLEAQSRSVEMLATSDRVGCPAGSAIAFVMDWQAIRPLLDHVALALEIEIPSCVLPDRQQCFQLACDLGFKLSTQRAMAFGSDQMLAQQRGLWQLIAARHQAMLDEQ
ncbi:MAG: DUF6975 family protein [Sphingorhabdus sp.]